MRLRTATSSITAVTAALVLAACGSDAPSTAAPAPEGSAAEVAEVAELEDGVLTVATEGTYSPFTFHEPGSGDLTGYDVEVARAVGEQLGVEVEFSETPFDAIFAGLQSSRTDAVANQVSITPERQATYAFSAPYTVSTGVVVTRADDTSVTSLDQIEGKTSAQSVTSNFAEIAKEAGATVEPVEGFAQAVTLLKQGRVDITINDDLAVLDYLKTTEDTEIKIAAETEDTTEQAFAFRKDSELAEAVDGALATLREDGTLASISEKWFGQDVSS